VVSTTSLRYLVRGLLTPNSDPRVEGSIPSLAITSNLVHSGHTVYISFRTHG
jgi:hypothetical protein